ncbi:MAG TPA: hypothetical protein VNH11_15775 [Pirellulales bacterium]|nr:hypothetical protein [Pirellulales bacterium]
MPIRLVVGAARSQVFPALFDPGTNHNLAIREQHIRDWTGMALRKLGAIRINGVVVPVVVADIELDGRILSNPDGIVLYPDSVPFAPRLPVLGLRTLVRNNVEVVIRGKDVIITP